MEAALKRCSVNISFALGALLVTALIFMAAGILTNSQRPPQDIIEPVGVSLVSLAPPEPPQQQEVKEPDPPPAQEKPDFTPDLIQPSLGNLSVGDVAISLNIGGVGQRQTTDNFIFDSVDLDQAPQALVRIPPEYPYKAREQGIEGYVAVKFLVKNDGSVSNVNILKAKPQGLFEDAVRRTLPRWKFQPGRIGGDAVTSWVVTTIRFDLN